MLDTAHLARAASLGSRPLERAIKLALRSLDDQGRRPGELPSPKQLGKAHAQLVDRARRRATGRDPFELALGLLASMYRSSENANDQDAGLIEFALHALAPVTQAGGKRLADPDAVLQDLRAARFLSSMPSQVSSARTPEQALAAAIDSWAGVRQPWFPVQERRMLRDLFATGPFVPQLEAEVGFRVEDAITCFEAWERRVPSELACWTEVLCGQPAALDRRRQALVDGLGDFRPETVAAALEAARCLGPTTSKLKRVLGDPRAKPKPVRHALGAWVKRGREDSFVADVPALATESGLPEEVVGAILEFLATPLQTLTAAAPVRTSGLFSDGGRYLAIAPTLPVFELRTRYEDVLRTLGLWNIYDDHRAKVTERRTAAILEATLRPTTLETGYHYTTVDKLVVEGDILAVRDHVVLPVEVKAGSLPSGGESRRHRAKALKAVVTKAAEQAHRIEQLRDAGLPVQLTDGPALPLPSAADVAPIVVTLDDPNAFSGRATLLAAAGHLTATSAPWIVSIHDLEVVAGALQVPAAFADYARKRVEMARVGDAEALDEHDLLDYYLECGDLPQDGAAVIRRGESVVDHWWVATDLAEQLGKPDLAPLEALPAGALNIPDDLPLDQQLTALRAAWSSTERDADGATRTMVTSRRASPRSPTAPAGDEGRPDGVPPS